MSSTISSVCCAGLTTNDHEQEEEEEESKVLPIPIPILCRGLSCGKIREASAYASSLLLDCSIGASSGPYAILIKWSMLGPITESNRARFVFISSSLDSIYDIETVRRKHEAKEIKMGIGDVKNNKENDAVNVSFASSKSRSRSKSWIVQRVLISRYSKDDYLQRELKEFAGENDAIVFHFTNRLLYIRECKDMNHSRYSSKLHSVVDAPIPTPPPPPPPPRRCVAIHIGIESLIRSVIRI